MKDDFKLPNVEVEKFKQAQESYKQKIRQMAASGPGVAPQLDHYERSIEFMKISAGLNHAEIDFSKPAHHRLLMHGLLLQERSITGWQKYEFTKQLSDQDFRFALSALGEHHRWQQEGTGSPNFLNKDNIDKLTALLGIIDGVPFVGRIAAGLQILRMKKDTFDGADIRAIETIKPGLFENDSFRKDFLNAFKVDQEAQISLDLINLKAFARANKIELDKLNQSGKEQLLQILKKLEAEETQQEFSAKMQAAKTAFADISGLGASIKNEGLIRTGIVGQNAVKIGESLQTLSSQVPALKSLFESGGIFATTLSGLAYVQPYIAIAAAFVQIGTTLFGKSSNDASSKHLAQALDAIFKSLEVIRKEMHERFDKVDEQLKEILQKIDTVYYALGYLIKINHDAEMQNINYGFSQVEEDIQQLNKVLKELIKAVHLDSMNSLIYKIYDHITGRVGKSDAEKLEKIKEAQRDLFRVWLNKHLVSDSYNGGIYSTNSTRTDLHFVGGDTFRVESALGFLHRYATNEDKLNLNLPDVSNERLPNVDLWLYAAPVALMARQYSAQAYGDKLEIAGIEELKKIVTNTNKFIDALAVSAADTTNPHSLFRALTAKYTTATQSLGNKLVKALAEQIKASSKEYTLRECIEQKWIDLTSNPDVTSGYIDKLNKHPHVAERTLCLTSLLATKLALGKYKITLKTPEGYPKKGTVGLGNRDHCQSNHAHVQGNTGSTIIHLTLSFVVENSSDNAILAEIHSSKAAEKISDCIYRNGAEMYLYEGIARKYDHYKVTQWLAIADISGIEVNKINIKSSLNEAKINDEQLYISMAKRIIALKQQGQNLAELLGENLARDCEELFQSAITTVKQNKFDTDTEVNMIRVVPSLMLAYADLIGLSKQTLNAVKGLMTADYSSFLDDPTNFSAVDNHAIEAIQQIQDALPHRVSSVSEKMEAINQLLKDYSVLATLYDAYEKDRAQWEQDATLLQQLVIQHQQMSAIRAANPEYFDQLALDNIGAEIVGLRKKITSSRDKLTDIFNQISVRGFNLASPPDIESIFTAPVSTSTDHTVKLRRGIPTPASALNDKSLIEIIENSANPYEDVSNRLSELPVEAAVSLVKALHTDGRTALHAAAQINDLPLIQLLVSFDASIAQTDRLHKKAIDYLAAESKQAYVFLSSREKWQADATDLEISVTRTASLLQEADAYVQALPASINSAVISSGVTGVGKSTVHNFLHGTDYEAYFNINGEKVLRPCNTVKEISPTSSNSTSATQLPVIHDIDGYTYIDMPGFDDTRGKEADIRTSVLPQLLAPKFNTIKAIQVVITDAELFGTRRTELRKTLRKIGLMLQKNPEQLSQHLLLVVTKPNKDRFENLAKNDQVAYEKQIHDLLRNWLSDEISKLPKDYADYPINFVLQNLQQNQVVLVDASRVETRKNYQDRLRALPEPIASEHFKFTNFDKNTEIFKHFIQKIDHYAQALAEEIDTTVGALCHHWQETAKQDRTYQSTGIAPDLLSELSTVSQFEHEQHKHHAEVIQLRHQLNEQVAKLANATHGIVGDAQIITEQLTRLIQELELNKPFFYRLAQIAEPLGIKVSDSLKQTNTAKAEKIIALHCAEDETVVIRDDDEDHEAVYCSARGKEYATTGVNNNAGFDQAARYAAEPNAARNANSVEENILLVDDLNLWKAYEVSSFGVNNAGLDVASLNAAKKNTQINSNSVKQNMLLVENLNLLTRKIFSASHDQSPAASMCESLSMLAGMIHDGHLYLPDNSAIFYSGNNGKNHESAKLFAQDNGKNMIDFTSIGHYLESANIYDRCAFDEAREAWNILSRKLSQNVKGDVYAFVFNSYSSSVFCQTEFAELIENKHVTRVILCPAQSQSISPEHFICEMSVDSFLEKYAHKNIHVSENCSAESGPKDFGISSNQHIRTHERTQTSSGNRFSPGVLSTLASATSTLFSWMPRFSPNFLRSTIHFSGQPQLTKETLKTSEADNLHLAAALSVAEQAHTPVYETYKVLEQHGFDADCDENLTTCTIKLSDQTIHAVNALAGEQREAQELIARTNPGAPAVFDSLLTTGMFAIAKGYQWYRGENKLESNSAEDCLLSANKVCIEKIKLANDFKELSKRLSTIAASDGFNLLPQSNQIEFYQEAQQSFNVLREQLDEFRAGEATVGDLLDLRHHIRDTNAMFDEVNALLGYDSGAQETASKKSIVPGLIYQPIPGDGHCLYNAVAIHTNSGDVGLLRNMVSAHLENNLEEFREFIPLDPGQTVEKYLEAVRNGNEWASHVEIEVLMRVLNRPILVITPDASVRNPADMQRFNGKPIFVLYNDRDHYDALLLDDGYTVEDILEKLKLYDNHMYSRCNL